MFSYAKRSVTEKSNKWVFGTMLFFGVIALVASFVLAIDEFQLLKDPNAVLSCSFNVVLNCSTVMKTWQAHVFGFPNMFIGLVGFPIVITVAIVGLTGARLSRWFWVLANICYGLGALFAYWLFFNSLYAIQILCPWCLIVTFSTTVIFSAITHYNLHENTIQFSKKANERIQSLLKKDVDKLLVASWVVLLIALVFIKFGNSLFA
jgi:uncharacterized membrane protein